MRGQFPLMLVVGVDTLKGVALGRSRGASPLLLWTFFGTVFFFFQMKAFLVAAAPPVVIISFPWTLQTS
jgi:hypothetical protein